MQFTVEQVQNLRVGDLQQALTFSERKWNWLCKEKASVLCKLFEGGQIEVCMSDCPMCKFVKSKINGDFCSCCTLDAVCRNPYSDAIDAFKDFTNGFCTITAFRKEARKVRDRIREIKKACFPED